MTFEEFARRAEEHQEKMKTDVRYRLETLRKQKEKIGTKEFDLEIYQLEQELGE